MGVSLLRELRQADIGCPAGSVHGGCGVYCAVEEHFIDGRREATSIEVFCGGDHTRCPTWRKEKDATAKGEKVMVEKPLEHQRLAQLAQEVQRHAAINPEVMRREQIREKVRESGLMPQASRRFK